jgi:hypothetical protein
MQAGQTRKLILKVLDPVKLQTSQDINALLGNLKTIASISSSLRRLTKRGLADGYAAVRNGHKCNEWIITNLGISERDGTSVKPSSKGNSRRTNMCAPTTKPSLINEVTDLVMSFVQTNKTFSAHDITKEMRERVNKGATSINNQETGVVFVGGKNVPRIEHQDVRDIVAEIFQSGQMTNYGREMSGDHFEYGPVTATNPLTPLVPPASSDPVGTPPVSSGGNYDGSSTL